MITNIAKNHRHRNPTKKLIPYVHEDFSPNTEVFRKTAVIYYKGIPMTSKY